MEGGARRGRPGYDQQTVLRRAVELFNRHVKGRFDVRGVVDDREQVVRMWREKGLTVAQVAEGKF